MTELTFSFYDLFIESCDSEKDSDIIGEKFDIGDSFFLSAVIIEVFKLYQRER